MLSVVTIVRVARWKNHPDLPLDIQKHAGEITWSFVVLGVLFAICAYQVIWGRGRWLPWVFAAVTFTVGWKAWWMLAVTGWPLVFLVAEAVSPWVAQKQTDEMRLRKANQKSWVWQLVISVPVVIAATWLFRHMPGVPIRKVGEPFMVFLGYMWLMIALHELGHAIGAWHMGYRFMELSVTPLVLRRFEGRWRLGLHWTLGGHYMGYPVGDQDLTRRYVWMVAAGPLANLAVFLVCWLALATAGQALPNGPFVFVRGLMEVSLVMGVINALPFQVKGIRTDGAYLWDAWWAPDQARCHAAVTSCMVSHGTELRPRDWPMAWVATLREWPRDPRVVAALHMWAMDRVLAVPEDTEAWATLEDSTRALEEVAVEAPHLAPAFRLQAAWARARYDNLTAGAVEVMGPAKKDRQTETYELLRLQAALAAANGRAGEAAQLLEAAEADLQKRPLTGFRTVDLEDLRLYREAVMAG